MYYFIGLDCLLCSSFFLTVITTFGQIELIILTVNKGGGSYQHFQWFDIRLLIRIIVFESRHHLMTTTRQCQQNCWISLPSSLPKPSFGPNRFIASSDDVSSSPQTNDDSGVGRWVSLSAPPLFLPVYGRSIHCPYTNEDHLLDRPSFCAPPTHTQPPRTKVNPKASAQNNLKN